MVLHVIAGTKCSSAITAELLISRSNAVNISFVGFYTSTHQKPSSANVTLMCTIDQRGLNAGLLVYNQQFLFREHQATVFAGILIGFCLATLP